jgi:hypothetical protein
MRQPPAVPARLGGLVTLATLAAVACGGDTPSQPRTPNTAVTTVVVSPDSVSLLPGGTVRLVATALDASGAVVSAGRVDWRSTDLAAVSVDSAGRVSALSPGSAIVSAAVGGKSGRAFVRVNLSGPYPLVAANDLPLPAEAYRDRCGSGTTPVRVIDGYLSFADDSVVLSDRAQSTCGRVTTTVRTEFRTTYTVVGGEIRFDPRKGATGKPVQRATLAGGTITLTWADATGAPPYTLTFRR